MIIRMIRGRVDHDRAGRFNAHIRDQTLPAMQGLAGLVGVTYGWNTAEGHQRFVLVSTWETISAMEGWTGPDLYYPRALEGVVGMAHDVTVEFFEAVTLQPDASSPVGSDLTRAPAD